MMNNPKRKTIRLKQYNYSENGAYHIVICSKDKAKIFSKVIGGDLFHPPGVQLTEYGRIVDKYINSTNRIQGVSVDKYIIMPNHIHMILIIDKGFGKPRASCPTVKSALQRSHELIPRAVASLKKLVNLEAKGNLFQDRYYDRVIRNHKEYLETYQYIENNPANWKYDKYYQEEQYEHRF